MSNNAIHLRIGKHAYRLADNWEFSRTRIYHEYTSWIVVYEFDLWKLFR